MTRDPRPYLWRTAVLATGGLVLSALPVFLVGGLAVQIRQDLGFSETELGAAVTVAFLCGAIAGPVGGRVADRVGGRIAIVCGSVLASLSLAGTALLARSWETLLAFLVLGGLSFAFLDPGLAIVINSNVDPRRQGFAFGIKEASIPASTLLAGLAVPVIALEHGWRWAFLLGIVPLAVVAVGLGMVGETRVSSQQAGGDGASVSRRTLLIVAAAAACASTASSGIGVFLTESAVAMGMAEGASGLLLATGSVAGIITRVATGIRADRDGGPQLGTIWVMMAVGAMSMALAAIGSLPLLVVGAVGAFAGGWGWTGLLFLTLVRANPSSPGAGAGLGLLGLAIGNGLGPLAFGAAAEQLSFTVAWAGAAVLAGLGAMLARAAAPAFQPARI
ncbi:MAG TPA: MFS transporter [Acidimicrobiia bacterium]